MFWSNKNFQLLILGLLMIGYSFAQSQVTGKCISGNCLNGTGKFRYTDSNVYDGQWKNAKPEGIGSYLWKDGDKYIGDFKNGKFNGKGKLFATNGDVYEGNYLDGMMEGEGSCLLKSGFKVGGTYIKNVLVKGYAIGLDGSRYEGGFVNNEFSGQGKGIFATGEIYIGEWQKSQRNGFGELRDKSGKLLYSGLWKQNEMVNPEESAMIKEQTLRKYAEIFSRNYKGLQGTKVGTQTGNAEINMEFTLYTDYSVTGNAILKLIIDNRTYSHKVHFKGWLDPKQNKLTATDDYFVWKEELPYQMTWTLGSFNLTVYSDNQHNGQFVLSGITGDGLEISLQEK